MDAVEARAYGGPLCIRTIVLILLANASVLVLLQDPPHQFSIPAIACPAGTRVSWCARFNRGHPATNVRSTDTKELYSPMFQSTN
jgi:hypothetical protein